MKKILFWIVMCLLSVGVSFWYLEKNVYCEVSQDYIKVYLYKADARKCQEYIYSLDQSIKLVYKDMVTVQQLIDLGRDAEYWIGIKAGMQSKIDGYQQMRSMIAYRVRTFEDNFFAKIKLYMEKYLLPYRQELEMKLENIESTDFRDFSGDMISDANTLVVSIQNQLLIIENILATRNLEELVSYLPSYLYLKKEIE